MTYSSLLFNLYHSLNNINPCDISCTELLYNILQEDCEVNTECFKIRRSFKVIYIKSVCKKALVDGEHIFLVRLNFASWNENIKRKDKRE